MSHNRSAIEPYPVGKPPSMMDLSRRNKTNIRVKTQKTEVKARRRHTEFESPIMMINRNNNQKGSLR